MAVFDFPHLSRLGDHYRVQRAVIENFRAKEAKSGGNMTNALHVSTLFSTCTYKGA